MAWNRVNVDQQRVQFVVAASRQEKPLQQLCQEFGISRPTGYVWLERYRQNGLAGMVEQSRRPHSRPGRTGKEREERVIQLRQRYPDWGERKLQVLLSRQGLWLPSSTIHRILLRHGLVRTEDRHDHAVQRFEREQPNELWQMDFKS